MATEVTYSGDGSNKIFNITFPFLKSDDVKVQVSGSTISASEYSITGTVVTTNTAPPAATGNVKLYRVTPIDSAVHDYSAGSTIRAKNLNDNQKQVLYGIEESKLVTVTSGGITTGSKNDVTVNSDTDWIINTDAIQQSMMGTDSVGTNEIINLNVTEGKLANGAVTTDKLKSDASTDSNRPVTTNHIRNDAVTYSKIQNGVTANRVLGITDAGTAIQELEVDTVLIKNEAITEAKLKADNDPADNKFLKAKSSAAGGLTWAEAADTTILRGRKSVKLSTNDQAIPDSYNNITGASITYTPTLSSSIIALEAHINMYIVPIDQTSNLQYSEFYAKFMVTPTGSSEVDVGEEMFLRSGASHAWGGNSYYGGLLNQQFNFYEEFTNSDTTEKTFKMYMKKVNGSMVVNDYTGNSWFTLKEYKP